MNWRRLAFKEVKISSLSWLIPFTVDLKTRPVKIDLSPSKALLFAIPAMSIFFAYGTWGYYFDDWHSKHEWVYAVACPIALLGSIYHVLRFAFTHRSVTFGHLDVEVSEPDGTQWRAKYSEFLGVRHRLLVKAGFFIPRSHAIELVHPDAEKNLPLFFENYDWAGQARLEQYAELLGVPVLEDLEDTQPQWSSLTKRLHTISQRIERP